MSETVIPPHDQSFAQRVRRALWKGLQLLLLPLVLIAGLIWYNGQQNQRSLSLMQRQQQVSMTVAASQRQDQLMTSYLSQMSDFLAHDKLLSSRPMDDVRRAAQALTLTVLPQMGPENKGVIMRFLFETQLINNDFRIINLAQADLSNALLRNVDLRDTDLLGANLGGANLQGANLSYATLVFTNFSGANLRGANIRGADMRNTNLAGAILAAANLKDVTGTSNNQLAQAKSLTGTILPDGSTHT